MDFRGLESQVRVVYFRNVLNATELLERAGAIDISEGRAVSDADAVPPSPQSTSRCAVLDLSNVASDLQVRGAVLKAILSTVPDSGFRGKTVSFRSNVIFNMSVSGRVTEAVNQFNVTALSSSVAVVGWVDEAGSPASLQEFEALVAAVQGTAFEPSLLLSDPEFVSDERRQRLVKLYKLAPLEASLGTLESSVITRLAVKEIM